MCPQTAGAMWTLTMGMRGAFVVGTVAEVTKVTAMTVSAISAWREAHHMAYVETVETVNRANISRVNAAIAMVYGHAIASIVADLVTGTRTVDTIVAMVMEASPNTKTTTAGTTVAIVMPGVLISLIVVITIVVSAIAPAAIKSAVMWIRDDAASRKVIGVRKMTGVTITGVGNHLLAGVLSTGPLHLQQRSVKLYTKTLELAIEAEKVTSQLRRTHLPKTLTRLRQRVQCLSGITRGIGIVSMLPTRLHGGGEGWRRQVMPPMTIEAHQIFLSELTVTATTKVQTNMAAAMTRSAAAAEAMFVIRVGNRTQAPVTATAAIMMGVCNIGLTSVAEMTRQTKPEAVADQYRWEEMAWAATAAIEHRHREEMAWVLAEQQRKEAEAKKRRGEKKEVSKKGDRR